uniref:Uncharacterized protein n=1 Tax=Knipowitschia caucasica TaxID=637954 RepID=A0AAV2MJT6_KNICA
MSNRRVWQLLKQWLDYEQELLDSERIWEDKQEKWFSGYQDPEDVADLWRKDEEKWLEEKQSSREILQEILGSSENLKEGSPEFLLELKHQICERRLQMERRRSMWLKKEAWYQGREASKTTVITLRKELRDLRGRCENNDYKQRLPRDLTESAAEVPGSDVEVPESAAEIPVSAAESKVAESKAPESEVQDLQQQLLLKEQMLVALRAKMEKQVMLQQSTQALVQAAKQVVEVSENKSFKRQKLLQLANEQCQQYFENRPNHSDSEEDVLVYSLTTGEMCTIDESRMEKLRSIFLKLREKHGAPGSEDEDSEEPMTPEMVDGLRTSLYQRIRKTNKHLQKYCIWVSTFCLETDKLCKIQDRSIKGFINCFFEWRELRRTKQTWSPPLNKGVRIPPENRFRRLVHKAFMPHTYKYRPSLEENDGSMIKVEDAEILNPAYFQWNQFLSDNPSEQVEYLDWVY